MATIAQKARELLSELAHENADPLTKWIGLDQFDPPFGKSEVTYATYHGFIENQGTRVRLTAQGLKHLRTKPRTR